MTKIKQEEEEEQHLQKITTVKHYLCTKFSHMNETVLKLQA